jgi:hypothetical protein
MPWALAAAGIAAGGSIYAGNQQAKAGQQAAETAMAPFNYLKGGPIGGQYIPGGGAANAAQQQLLGVGGVDEAATKQQILTALKQNVGQGYDQAYVSRIEQMINSGAPLGAITAQLSQLQSTTTSKNNAQGMAALMGAVNNPVMSKGSGNAFDNWLNSTGYKFRLQSGSDAITNNMAARGLLNSGATGKALMDFGQNLGSSEFGNYFNQLGSLSGQGLQGAGVLAGVPGSTSAAGYVAGAGADRAAGWGGAAGLASNYLGSLGKPKSATYDTTTGDWIPGRAGF